LRDDWKAQASDEFVRELQEHVKQSTAPYKYPRRIAFIEELPRTPTGKVRRKTLRDLEYSQVQNGEMNT
jgi:acyl-coenzyme A synthetase/AMP-(fatty) acid ligase